MRPVISIGGEEVKGKLGRLLMNRVAHHAWRTGLNQVGWTCALVREVGKNV